MTPGIKSMTAEFTVGAGFARGLLDFAVRKGADREALLAAAGLEAADLEDESYIYSWLPPENAATEAQELSERGPEAFPD